MIKIVHIHSDPKFVHEINTYKGPFFENILLFLGPPTKVTLKLENPAFFFEEEDLNIKEITAICNEAQIVTLNDLTIFKSKIALALDKKVIIAWRLFGYELYGKKINRFLSEKTKQVTYVKPSLKVSLIKKIKKLLFLSEIKQVVIPPSGLFIESIKRINVFFGIFEEEYSFLKKEWPMLPHFMKIAVNFNVIAGEYRSTKKEDFIILGNSRNRYNNHFDLLDIVKESKGNFKCKMFFSYGTVNLYSKKVKEAALESPKVEVLEDFLSISEFEAIYKNASALVMNAYRQMALANIFTAIKYGTKIYLSKHNITLEWMLNQGFKVYSIEDFVNDYENNNLKLSEADAVHNYNQLVNFYNDYTVSDFQKKLLDFFNKRSSIDYKV